MSECINNATISFENIMLVYNYMNNIGTVIIIWPCFIIVFSSDFFKSS